ncbi:gliding motility lipoprotein GldB [Snuella sedimenti]|uniref:Gliding motility lipoprotein GldB n=1 Tax=Snuella sedimenti TaxID=2798802 RepID=A0A8J7LRK0_9FLAO|nr:gliding motility lipoprotein GldB [Snuella sedimenti]MBJ6366561.1 gliding motility lipoprotein GldB [Snuella sedimenti]
MKHLLPLIGFIAVVFSCKTENQIEKTIAAINIDVDVERYDKLFSEITVQGLPKLKRAYPFMFAEKYSDSFWIAKKQDTLQMQLASEVAKAFPNFKNEEAKIESLFNHLRYYFPNFNPPRIITTTSDVDYRNKVIVTDTIALISLDTYLGSDHEFYSGIQKYTVQNLRKEQIVVDLANEYAKRYTFQQHRKTLLDEMIYFGKLLYFKDVVIPFVDEKERIGYSQEQLDWAIANESYIWRYFVERELLFSTDSKLPGRFINPAPFSKFYLEEIDKESPGRLGQYLGWQIVRAYMEKNNVPLKDMLIMSAEDIFNNSKFKPRK